MGSGSAEGPALLSAAVTGVHSPSISTSTWFRVFSCSLQPLKCPQPRFLTTASISSMKKIQGAFFSSHRKRVMNLKKEST